MIGSITLPLFVIIGYATPCPVDTLDRYVDDYGSDVVMVTCASETPRVHRNWDGSRGDRNDFPVDACPGCYSSESSIWDAGDAVACVPTACTEYEVTPANGYVFCFDNDQEYQPGQWSYVAGESDDMVANRMSFGYVTVAW